MFDFLYLAQGCGSLLALPPALLTDILSSSWWARAAKVKRRFYSSRVRLAAEASQKLPRPCSSTSPTQGRGEWSLASQMRGRGGGGGGRRGVGGGRCGRRRGRRWPEWWREVLELMIPGCWGWGAPWPLDLEEGPAIGRRIRHPSRHSWWTRRRMPHPHHRRRTSSPLSPPPPCPATIRLEIG